ncbi:MAG TPA: biotin/lipoate A/B protein ligase family protein [Solirubrobacteraceae bacterium]|nr:biotin/lipoate A/B protein ligase family protein [Solirubrobacteraceae bacterium]
MSVWRLICDDGAGAAEGLATDEALMLHHGRGETPPSEATLRLYTYRPHCALVGRYQAIDAEIDRDACARAGIDVGRRPTGGGAIIMGPEQLGVAIASRSPAGIGPRDLLRQYAGGIVTGLAELGVHARFRGKNDLEVDGRKVAGLGLYLDDRGALLFHASVLAALDVELMLSVLRIPGAKLADKGVARVQERITTVSEQAGHRLDGAQLRDAIAEGFRRTLGVQLARSQLDAPERRRAAALATERYAAEEWLSARTPPGDTRGTSAVKTPAGFVRIYVGVQRDALSSVMIAGDFSVMPPELLALEASLRWCRADPERIAAIADREMPRGALGVPPEVLAGAVWSAAERALQRAGGAAPMRTEGSCYFPEPAMEVTV